MQQEISIEKINQILQNLDFGETFGMDYDPKWMKDAHYVRLEEEGFAFLDERGELIHLSKWEDEFQYDHRLQILQAVCFFDVDGWFQKVLRIFKYAGAEIVSSASIPIEAGEYDVVKVIQINHPLYFIIGDDEEHKERMVDVFESTIHSLLPGMELPIKYDIKIKAIPKWGKVLVAIWLQLNPTGYYS